MSGSAIMMGTAFLLPIAAAWLALERWWPGGPTQRSDRLLRLSLAGPFGAGLSSLFFFVWALAFDPSGRAMVIVETVVLFLAVIILFLMIFRNKTREVTACLPKSSSTAVSESLFPGRLINIVACAGIASLALVSFISRLLESPHGGWDAWAIWNLRARFLYRSGPFWTDSFSPELFWSSPDYPLGLPGFVASGWKFLGSETVLIPMLVAIVFFLAIGGLLFASLRCLTGQSAAVMGLIALTGTPLFIRHAAFQEADVPVAFFFLATTALMATYDNDTTRHRGWLVLAGIAVSLAAWTKNEGLLFLLALATARVTLRAFQKKWQQLGREGLNLLLGAAPTLAVLVTFKIRLAPPSGFFSQLSWDTVCEKLFDWSRYQETAPAFFKAMSTFGGSMGVLIIITLILVGFERSGFRQKRWLSGMIVLGLMLIGYFFIYIVTPERLSWHLATSLNRLLLQLWPMTVFLVYLNLREVGASKSRTG